MDRKGKRKAQKDHVFLRHASTLESLLLIAQGVAAAVCNRRRAWAPKLRILWKLAAT